MSSEQQERQQQQRRLRVGILGAAGIAFKNGDALQHLESGCEVAAVASRTLEKAESLVKSIDPTGSSKIALFAGPTGYNDLLESSNAIGIDAVYIPLPTALHKEWVIKALAKKLHVMVEKPVALTAIEFEEMMAKSYQVNKFLMDGTMYVHHGRTKNILERCRDNNTSSSYIGEIKRIEAAFTFAANPDFFETNIRCKPDADPLGAIGDLAWYCVRMALVVFRQQKAGRPIAAQAVDFTTTDDGIPIDATCIVFFERDRKIVLHCGFTTRSRQNMAIVGRLKTISMDDFVVPTAPPVTFRLESLVRPPGERLWVRDYETVEPTYSAAGDTVLPPQQVHMWNTFSRIARDLDNSSSSSNATTETNGWSAAMPSVLEVAKELIEISLWNQKIMDALMQSIQTAGQRVDIKA